MNFSSVEKQVINALRMGATAVQQRTILLQAVRSLMEVVELSGLGKQGNPVTDAAMQEGEAAIALVLGEVFYKAAWDNVDGTTSESSLCNASQLEQLRRWVNRGNELHPRRDYRIVRVYQHFCEVSDEV